jgi:hypothetical protein
VTEDGSVLGTLTFPPVTVFEYALSTMTVAGGGRRRQAEMVVQASLNSAESEAQCTNIMSSLS